MAKQLVFGLALLFGFLLHSPAKVFFNTGADWKYFKGRSEASTPDVTAWRQPGFNDGAFTPACAPFWYGDVLPGGTQLTDMMNQYTTIYMRRTFNVENLADIAGLRLGFQCDDGFIAWINGVEAYRYNVPAGQRAYNTSATGAITEPALWTEVNVLPAATN